MKFRKSRAFWCLNILLIPAGAAGLFADETVVDSPETATVTEEVVFARVDGPGDDRSGDNSQENTGKITIRVVESDGDGKTKETHVTTSRLNFGFAEDQDEAPPEETDAKQPADSDKKTVRKFSGKIVITTPDGRTTEYDMGEDNDTDMQIFDVKPGDRNQRIEIQTAETQERFMIGIHCDSAPEIVRRHLKIGDVGLVVESVVPESPAEAAGLKEGDILIKAAAVELKEPKDLQQVIKESEGNEIEIHLIHDGETLNLSLSPKKMKPGNIIVMGGTPSEGHWFDVETAVPPGELKDFQRLRGLFGNGQIHRFSPGIAVNKSMSAEDMEKLVADAMEAAQAAREKSFSVSSKERDMLNDRIAELERANKLLEERVKQLEVQK
ncbi:MAG: PDZ domain-containing protein [Planctomycetaceae bacterium]